MTLCMKKWISKKHLKNNVEFMSYERKYLTTCLAIKAFVKIFK